MRRLSVLVALLAGALTLTACGGPTPPPAAAPEAEAREMLDELMESITQAGGLADDTGLAGEDGAADADSGFGAGDSDAPVVVTIDGVDFGYRHGSCWIDENVVRVNAANDNPLPLRDMVELVWYPPLQHLPYSRQETYVAISTTATVGPAPFALFADSSVIAPDSTWSVTVDGSSVELTGTLTHDARFAGAEPRAEEVRIVADCAEKVFGDGPPMGSMPVDGEMGIDVDTILGYLIDGHIDVEFLGATHSIEVMSVCSFPGGDVTFEGISNDLHVRAYQGSTHSLRLEVGDERLRDDRILYQLADGAALAFAGDGATRTWSGIVVGPQGEQEPVSLAVTCPVE